MLSIALCGIATAGACGTEALESSYQGTSTIIKPRVVWSAGDAADPQAAEEEMLQAVEQECQWLADHYAEEFRLSIGLDCGDVEIIPDSSDIEFTTLFYSHPAQPAQRYLIFSDRLLLEEAKQANYTVDDFLDRWLATDAGYVGHGFAPLPGEESCTGGCVDARRGRALHALGHLMGWADGDEVASGSRIAASMEGNIMFAAAQFRDYEVLGVSQGQQATATAPQKQNFLPMAIFVPLPTNTPCQEGWQCAGECGCEQPGDGEMRCLPEGIPARHCEHMSLCRDLDVFQQSVAADGTILQHGTCSEEFACGCTESGGNPEWAQCITPAENKPCRGLEGARCHSDADCVYFPERSLTLTCGCADGSAEKTCIPADAESHCPEYTFCESSGDCDASQSLDCEADTGGYQQGAMCLQSAGRTLASSQGKTREQAETMRFGEQVAAGIGGNLIDPNLNWQVFCRSFSLGDRYVEQGACVQASVATGSQLPCDWWKCVDDGDGDLEGHFPRTPVDPMNPADCPKTYWANASCGGPRPPGSEAN